MEAGIFHNDDCCETLYICYFHMMTRCEMRCLCKSIVGEDGLYRRFKIIFLPKSRKIPKFYLGISRWIVLHRHATRRPLYGGLLFSLAAITSQGSAQSIGLAPLIKAPREWSLGRFQAKLDERLRACGLPGIKVDQLLGKGTAEGIRRLGQCPGFVPADTAIGRITSALWQQLIGEPFPSLAERAYTLTYNFEGTDYTSFLWNVGQPADPTAFGTWGPFGATLAQTGEIQRILRKVSQAPAGRAPIDAAFQQALTAGIRPVQYSWRAGYCSGRVDRRSASGSALLLGLSTPLSDSDRRQLSSAFCDNAEYWVWPAAFALLGERADIRSAYDAYYRDQNRRIAQTLADLYKSLGFLTTETDWAFFLDRATQFTTDIANARNALQALPASASPAARRLAVSRASRPGDPAQKRLRVGRDMAFVAGSSSELLDDYEKGAWQYVRPLTAEQLGLGDRSDVCDNPY
jgi:hypothetical protein